MYRLCVLMCTEVNKGLCAGWLELVPLPLSICAREKMTSCVGRLCWGH